MKQKMRGEEKMIVITGAAGFIGSCLVKYLNEQNFFRLVLIDDLKIEDQWTNLVGKKFEAIISQADTFRFLQGRGEEIFALIHLGACSDTTEKNADFLLENNYRFSIKLAEYAFEHAIRFIYASSAATYGDGTLGFSDDESKLESLHPLNMYGYSKHLFDLWLFSQKLLGKVVGLKYFNVFGPNEYHKGRMASMIYHMFFQVQNEGKVRLFKSNSPMYKDGEQCRDFIYVKDAVRMTASFLNNDFCGIFNIGSGKRESWNSLACKLFDAMNRKVSIEYIDMPENLYAQYQNDTCAEMKKYFALFPECPMTEIESSVKEYVQEYLLRKKRW